MNKSDDLPTASGGLAVISSKAWNAVVHALRKSWIKPGTGVRVDRSPNGTKISTGPISGVDRYWQITRAEGGVNIYGGTQAEWDYHELSVGWVNAGHLLYSAYLFPDIYVATNALVAGNNFLAGADEEGFICLKMELIWYDHETYTGSGVYYGYDTPDVDALTVVWVAGAVPAQTQFIRHYPLAGISATGEIHQLVEGQIFIEQINHGFASEFVRAVVPLYWQFAGWDLLMYSDHYAPNWIYG